MKTEGDCHPQILLLQFDSKDTEGENVPLSPFCLSFFLFLFPFLLFSGLWKFNSLFRAARFLPTAKCSKLVMVISYRPPCYQVSVPVR